MGLHKSKLSYGIGLPLELDRSETRWPDGMNGDVRVRYFDPATGAPRASPASKESAALPKREPGRGVPAKGRRGKPVVVDGTEYPSIRMAAEAVGVTDATLGCALHAGRTSCNGHEVSWAAVR